MVIGIILSLALLIYFAYRGYSVIFMAPIFALLAALTAGMNVLPTYTELFMVKMVGYIKNFFPIFMLGAVFGKIMEDSGAARAVAHFIIQKLGKERAIVATVLSCAILTYGGVSLFVVAFAVYPLAAAMFKEADIPKRLIPGAIALGAFTFTMTAIPGTPQIQNIIPTKYFGTNAYAAPLVGILGALLMFAGGLAWLEWRKRRAMAAGEGYGSHTKNEPMVEANAYMPRFGLALLPLIIVLVLNYILTRIINGWNPDILKPFGATALASVAPTWALIVALVLGIVVAVLLNWKEMKTKYVNSLNIGTIGSLLAIMNTASEVGYGNVISALPGFKAIAAALLGIKGTPLLSETVTVNILAGITGSASGGMSIALETMGTQYLQWANRVGLNPELLHRIASMSSGGFDTLPHNGAVITLLAITGLTHRQSYIDIGMVSLVVPVVSTLLLILLTTLLGII